MGQETEVLLSRAVKMLDEFMIMQPAHYTLSELANLCNVSNDTLRKHLITHYKSDRDYFQKVNNGKIIIVRAVALSIRRHYA